MNNSNPKGIYFRKLEPSDRDVIFNWISKPELRKLLGTRDEITAEGHSKWFLQKCSEQENITCIIELDGISIGLIGTNRFSSDDHSAEMYLYIGDPQNRGHGVGHQAIILFTKMLFATYSVHKVTARVFSFNQHSKHAFEKAGFVIEGIQKDQLRMNEQFYDLIWLGIINHSEK